MTIHPIIAALKKHKAGTLLLGLQVAFTLAIVCNILFIVADRGKRIERLTGLDEDNLFLISQSFITSQGTESEPNPTALDALQSSDLSTLRGLGTVAAATPVSTLPLLRYDSIQDISTSPGQANGLTQASFFFGDQDLISTFGLHLLEGRNFTISEVTGRAASDRIAPPSVIVTQALADKVYPAGNALGKIIFVNNNSEPSVIIGVVERLLTSQADGPDAYALNSVIVPARVDKASTMYAVRAKPGELNKAMEDARSSLFKANPMRIIEEHGAYSPSGIHTYAQIRHMGYALDEFMVQVLTMICAVLLAITGVGMTGLTSFWVNQRHRQIGIRRALGAKKRDIMNYFQAENLIISGAGCLIGIVLTVAINVGLMRLFEMPRMPLWYIVVGVMAIQALGQIAVLVPAWKASRVSPIAATRMT